MRSEVPRWGYRKGPLLGLLLVAVLLGSSVWLLFGQGGDDAASRAVGPVVIAQGVSTAEETPQAGTAPASTNPSVPDQTRTPPSSTAVPDSATSPASTAPGLSSGVDGASGPPQTSSRTVVTQKLRVQHRSGTEKVPEGMTGPEAGPHGPAGPR